MSPVKKNHGSEIDTKRMSLSLSGNLIEEVEYLAESQGISQNEAIRKAIGTECYIRKEVADSSKFFVLKSDGRSLEVVFR
jgi:metal-responsive CopG/Arc/MetJ family transcriptional regulator